MKKSKQAVGSLKHKNVASSIAYKLSHSSYMKALLSTMLEAAKFHSKNKELSHI